MEEPIKRKKKKYLYLEKFATYAEIVEIRLSALERNQLWSNILLIIIGISILALVIFK